MLLRVLLAASLLAPCASCAGAPVPTETIILLRHGEKPPAGLGQLDCQGLNRALALPAVIRRDFGRPAAIFAPDPADMKSDGGIAYAYIRPLATIEPTAITFGMPIDVSHGVGAWQDVGLAVQAPKYAGATVIIAWEHSDIVKLARWLMTAHGANATEIPDWNKTDFDSLFVLRLTGKTITFRHQQEGLNAQSVECP